MDSVQYHDGSLAVSSLSCGEQAAKLQLETTVSDYRSSLATARQDYSAASSELTAMTRRVAVLEGRLSAKEAETTELSQQLSDLRHTKVGLERASAMDASKLQVELQVRCVDAEARRGVALGGDACLGVHYNSADAWMRPPFNDFVPRVGVDPVED